MSESTVVPGKMDSGDYYEMEFFQYESELHEKMEHCAKNPSHTGFFSVSNLFLPNHLPSRYHGTLWIDYINTIIHLTVKLITRCTSKERPDGDPCADLRGIPYGRSGTGRVTRTVRKFAEISDEMCPCQSCKENPADAKRQWGIFEVLTSHHVVFNDEECRKTTCDVGFDTDELMFKCPKLEGVGMIRYDESKDLAMISCVIHDEKVCNELEQMVAKFYDIRRNLQDLCKKSRNNSDYISTVPVICVSHPHGMSKHVSIGEWTGQKGKEPPHKWTYTAQTCGGSSGAPVFMLGGYGLSCTNLSTHSGSQGHGRGECGWEGWHL